MPDQKPTSPKPELANMVQCAIEAGMVISEPRMLKPDGLHAPLVVVPEGAELRIPDMENIEPWLERPMRKSGIWSFANAESFCRYFNEHKDANSRIFAQVSDTGAGISATLNFHGDKPSFNDHHCTLNTRETREWHIWCGRAKEKMNQDAFAQFLEDNADMFTSPSGADLLELITTLEGKAHVDFTTAVKMQNRAVQLSYSETVELKGGTSSREGAIVLPQLLNVAIAPFEGTARFSMSARLRYRIESRKLTFWYEPVDSHLVVRQVVGEILTYIEKQTGTQPFRT